MATPWPHNYHGYAQTSGAKRNGANPAFSPDAAPTPPRAPRASQGRGRSSAHEAPRHREHRVGRERLLDALDVVGVHFVGGLVGSLMIGLFADSSHFGAEHLDGLFYGGGVKLLLEQAIANGVTIIYSAIVTALILLAIKATVGLRVSDDEELTGLDSVEHGETAYHFGEVTMGRG